MTQNNNFHSTIIASDRKSNLNWLAVSTTFRRTSIQIHAGKSTYFDWGQSWFFSVPQILAMKASFYISSNTVFTVIPQLRRHTSRTLTTTIVAPPSNARKWQMGFNSAFKGNALNAELNPICHLLALLGGATIVVVSRLRVTVSLNKP